MPLRHCLTVKYRNSGVFRSEQGTMTETRGLIGVCGKMKIVELTEEQAEQIRERAEAKPETSPVYTGRILYAFFI